LTAPVSVDDYRTTTGQVVAPEEAARVQDLLDASWEELLIGANGQNLVTTTYTAATLYNRDGRFWFPQRPVTAVSSVVVDGVTLTVNTDYRWEAGGNGRPGLLIRRVNGYDSVWTDAEATVTYVAGWATLPGPLRGVVCTMAKRSYQGSTATPFVEVTPSGAFGESYPQSRIDDLPPHLTPALQKQVDRWTKVRGYGSVEMRRG